LYPLIAPLISSNNPFVFFWLPLCCRLITLLVSSDHSSCIFWIPIRYLLIKPLLSSDYPFCIFLFPPRYLLITPFVSSAIPFIIFLFTLWYLQTFCVVVIDIVDHLLEEGVIKIRNSTKNRQHNDQKKKYKRTNNDLQNIKLKIKER